ncbi:hypothetical protein ACIQPS_14305 [Streptomyces sp. NPDC091290]|uniref:hypothetical protein n=1 Tax=Streptomyces sp. NPDC091290 TaxID=3365990 RepID=UPI0037F401E8
MSVEAFSAAGSFVAAVVALGIALRQHYAAQEVLRSAQHERATFVAVTRLNKDEVVVKNLGQTPIFSVELREIKAELWDRDEDTSYVVGRARPSKAARVWMVLAPDQEVRVDISDWRDWDDGSPLTAQDLESLGSPTVVIRYRDAAGTVWQRENNFLPERSGGTPLPGTVRTHHQIRRSLRPRMRTLRRNVRLGVQGKGFTAAQQRTKRRQRSRANAARNTDG